MGANLDAGTRGSMSERASEGAAAPTSVGAGSTGSAAATSLLAQGVRELGAYAQLIAAHPEARNEIYALLQRALGNAALQEIMRRSDATPDPAKTWASSEVAMTGAPSATALPASVADEIVQRTGGAGEVDLGTNPRAPGKAAVAARSAALGADPDGRVLIDGTSAEGAVKGSESLDEMGGRLGAGLPFERFRATARDGEVAIEGKVNPWVRIVAGRIAEIRDGDMWDHPGAGWSWVDPAAAPVLDGPAPRSAPNWNLLPPPRLPHTDRAHQTPEAYAAAEQQGGLDGMPRDASLYRGVRSLSAAKTMAPSSALRDMGEPSERVSAPPDGGMFGGGSALAQQQQYHQLSAWPQPQPDQGAPLAPSIRSVDPTANEPVVRQVAGDNIGTQYISTSKHLQIACRASAYNWAGAGGLGGLRPPRSWGPVIQIDVRRLSEGRQRLYDLSSDGPHRDTLFDEGRTPEKASAVDQIKTMADRDHEVLVEGAVPPEAIVRVWSVGEMVKLLLATDESFLTELRAKVLDDAGRVHHPRDRALLEEAGVLARVETAHEMQEDSPPSAKWDSKKRDTRDEDDEEHDAVSSAKARQATRKPTRGGGLTFSSSRLSAPTFRVRDRVRLVSNEELGTITGMDGDRYIVKLDNGDERTVRGSLLERL